MLKQESAHLLTYEQRARIPHFSNIALSLSSRLRGKMHAKAKTEETETSDLCHGLRVSQPLISSINKVNKVANKVNKVPTR